MNCELFLLLALCAPPITAPSAEQQVETDWRRHDEQRLSQMREPGLVRFVETETEWPGVRRDDRVRVPNSPAPQLDGSFQDACWQRARRFPSGLDEPSEVLLTRDDRNLYVGFSLPTETVAQYKGHFTARDAAGAVDGIKDGKYGFHTWLDANPWWQVDLGAKQALHRIVVYNRLDYAPGLHNADHLIILTSEDEKNWSLCHDNHGEHFGGATSGAPLEVTFAPRSVNARFVRLQLRHEAPIFFHLDEVEIFSSAEPEKNIALNQPSKQSSLSRWSRGGERGNELFALGNTKMTFAAGDLLQMAADDVPLSVERTGSVEEGGRTCVEFSLPLRNFKDKDAVQIVPRQGEPVRLALDEDWHLDWRVVSEPGYGKNRLALQLQTTAAMSPPVEVVVETVAFTPARPERRIVFRRLFAGPLATTVDFDILNEGPVAILVSSRRDGVGGSEGQAFLVPPVRETLRRTERLLADFGILAPDGLADLRARFEQLAQRERAEGPNAEARAALYREARWLARDVALSNPLLDFDSLVLVKRLTQQTYPDVCLNHMPWCSRPGGDVCVVSPPRPDGKVRPLINGQLGPGHVHGMDLWYDADRVVFGYARSDSDQPPEKWLIRTASYDLRRNVEPTHLFEVGIDGDNLRQLTRGEWSDLDPTYLPSGEVAFTSERCGYSLQCNELDKDETSCNLYVVDGEGEQVRRLTLSKDGDYLPHTMDNGMIAYTRWEYQERGWANIQSIWVVRPDGTGADALFKQHFNDPWALEDARSIPGSAKMVAIATGHHTLPTGPVVIVDPTVGINNPQGIQMVTPGVLPPEGGMSGRPVAEGGVLGAGGMYQTPWPLSERHFLVSYTYGGTQDEKGYAIYLIDVHGTRELLYRDPQISCSYPIPLRPRRKPPVLGPAIDPTQDYATCLVTDIYEGVDGVEAGDIRYVRISSRLPWPYDIQHGGHRFEPDVKRVMINWTPARVIGTVPVEPDGSAYFRVPVDVPLYFQALDADHMEVRRMRSFINFQPGEVRGCTGCHETRGAAPINLPRAVPVAMRRQPSAPQPPTWGTDAMNFLRDVQPVFDRHCTSCHSGLEPEGAIDLSGGLTANYNRAWETINEKQLISRSDVGDDARVTLPYQFGSHDSKLVQILQDDTHAAEVSMSPDDRVRLITWIDLNGPYHDSFLNKRSPQPTYNLAADEELRNGILAVHQTRCSDCHQVEQITRTDWIDIFRPEDSPILAAPLAVGAGGTGKCDRPPYQATDDPGYQAVLQIVRSAVRKTWERPRRDVRRCASDKRRNELLSRIGRSGP